MFVDKFKEQWERSQRNRDILNRRLQGDALMGRPQDTWFPPRPSIKKDEEAVKRLYERLDNETPAKQPTAEIVSYLRVVTEDEP